MQLYALNKEKQLLFVGHAAKQQDYYCLECSRIVRVRSGVHRHAHYYHLSTTPSCRLSGKSMAHIQIQAFIQGLLPAGECFLEHRFPSINRIADVAWVNQKIIFEIQCSFISSEEVAERNRDYQSQGFHVIWFLHDARYNQVRLSAAEDFLQDHPHYFTNINATGDGIIYDQFSLIEKGIRKKTLEPLKIDPRSPLFHSKEHNPLAEAIPKILSHRLKNWPIGFSGDLTDLYFNNPNQYLQDILDLEKSIPVEVGEELTLLQKVFRAIVRPYRLFFQIMLERACR